MKKIGIFIMFIVLLAVSPVISLAGGIGYAHEDKNLSAEEAPRSASLLKVERLNVAHIDSMLHLDFVINPKKLRPGADRQIVFTPMVVRNLKSGVCDTIVLDSVIVAGRNRYYSHLRKGHLSVGDSVYKAGSKKLIKYSRAIPWPKGMKEGYVFMREQTQDCCRPVKPLCTTPIAQINSIDDLATNNIESIEYIPLRRQHRRAGSARKSICRL